MAYEFLVDSTNRLFAMQATAAQVTSGDLAEALSIVCKTASQLASDHRFLSAADDFERLSAEEQREVRSILRDTEQFCSVFLGLERGLFEKAGFGPLAVDLLIESAQHLRSMALEENMTSSQLKKVLVDLEFTSCERAQTLMRWEAENVARVNRRSWIARLGTACGGLGIIALNGGLMIPTLGLSAPQAALSSTIGGSLLTLGTRAIWKDVPPRR